jgi:hypothetical protein
MELTMNDLVGMVRGNVYWVEVMRRDMRDQLRVRAVEAIFVKYFGYTSSDYIVGSVNLDVTFGGFVGVCEQVWNRLDEEDDKGDPEGVLHALEDFRFWCGEVVQTYQGCIELLHRLGVEDTFNTLELIWKELGMN